MLPGGSDRHTLPGGRDDDTIESGDGDSAAPAARTSRTAGRESADSLDGGLDNDSPVGGAGRGTCTWGDGHTVADFRIDDDSHAAIGSPVALAGLGLGSGLFRLS